LANIKVFAVPRSTARSEERKLNIERMLTAILFPHPGLVYTRIKVQFSFPGAVPPKA
jgi:hypothetical protein